MFARVSPVVGVAALFALIPSPSVHAQQSGVLESVTIWAQKREADLPMYRCLSLLCRTTIFDRGPGHRAQVAGDCRPWTFRQRDRTTTTLRIRRVGNLGNIPTFEPAVGLFVDGAFRSRSLLGASDLLDVERIEV